MTLDLHALANMPGFGNARRKMILSGDLDEPGATCWVAGYEIRGVDVPVVNALRAAGEASTAAVADALNERDSTAKGRNRHRLEALVRGGLADRLEEPAGREGGRAVRVTYRLKPGLAAALDEESPA